MISAYKQLLPLHLVALEVARSMVGTEETTANWGPQVRAFLAAANVYVPAPWCAGFVNWCAEQAANLKGVPSPLEEVSLQAYVESYYQWAEQDGLLVPPQDVGPGDLFLLYYPSLKRHGHIGFVDEMLPGAYRTIEGNTGKEGEREGYAVLGRVRRLTNLVKFIRWA